MTETRTTITLYEEVGAFAENKDRAREIRQKQIIPALEKREIVILDFEKITSTTQSFIHALISDVIRVFGYDVLDRIYFKNCNEVTKAIIEIVVAYMQRPPTNKINEETDSEEDKVM